MGNHLVVEYVTPTPTERAIWRQNLARLCAYWESLDVDALNHQRGAGVRVATVKHIDAHVHARGVRE